MAKLLKRFSGNGQIIKKILKRCPGGPPQIGDSDLGKPPKRQESGTFWTPRFRLFGQIWPDFDFLARSGQISTFWPDFDFLARSGQISARFRLFRHFFQFWPKVQKMDPLAVKILNFIYKFCLKLPEDSRGNANKLRSMKIFHKSVRLECHRPAGPPGGPPPSPRSPKKIQEEMPQGFAGVRNARTWMGAFLTF